MLTLKVISTVIMGIVCFISFFVCCAIFSSGRHEFRNVCLSVLISWAILSVVIVTLWVA